MANLSKEEFYRNLEGELQIFENKLNKWNPTNSEGKRLKGQLKQTLDSLRLTNAMKTGCGIYQLDTMKFNFLKSNLK
jgi:hypothetical protein